MAVKKSSHSILAVHVTDRLKEAGLIQKYLSQHGDVIKTRLGLHEVARGYSSPEGILILDIVNEAGARRLQRALGRIGGVETRLVVFKH